MELSIPRSPKAIAGTYCTLGAVWVTVSYLSVHTFVDDPALLTWVQLLIGLGFVAGSTLALYVLVVHSRRDLQHANEHLNRANDRLDRSLTQSSILQRLLRHNLRNSCNVIAGNAAMLEQRADADAKQPLQTIQRQTDRLVDLGERTGSLGTVFPEETAAGEELDLTTAVESAVGRVRSRYPDADIRTTVPDRLPIETDPDLEIALNELLENAVVHDDDPSVTVAVVSEEGWITISISDSGPGIPVVEQEALERGIETPIVHSEGLGLWIAHTVVTRASGHLEIETERDEGTTVTVRLPVC